MDTNFIRRRSKINKFKQTQAHQPIFLSRRIEHAFDVTVQRSHDADVREHRWPAMLCNQKQSLHRGLPFVGIVFCLWQLSDVERGVA
jgi:hypothetical protein